MNADSMNTSSTPSSTPKAPGLDARAPLSGALLVATSALSVLLMAHHPTTAAHDVEGALAAMVRVGPLSQLVHGGLIALMTVQTLALVDVSARLGLERPIVRAALLAHATGYIAMVGATLISGFFLPKLGLRYAGETGASLESLRYVLGASSVGNRTLASFASVAMATGVALWSCALITGPLRERLIGALGLLVGVAPAIAILTGALRLEVPGMMLVTALLSAWNVAVGAALLRGGIRGGAPSGDSPLRGIM
jgi:hypothetical protein